MRWSDRQLAMLREMGIRLWLPPDPVRERALEAAGAVAVPDAAAPVEAPSVASRPGSLPAGRDWPALRAAAAACVACPLGAGGRRQAVGSGNPQAHWMIVGDIADETGKPLQLLDNMLRAVGLTRDAADPARQVCIASSVKCRPPGDRNPEPAELAACEPFLADEVRLVRPRIILALGRFAVQALLGSTEPLGRLRGTVHRYRGVPVVVTYPPAYLLRHPADKARAWDDLCLALGVAAAPPPADPAS